MKQAKLLISAAAIGLTQFGFTNSAVAEPVGYTVDSLHTMVAFKIDHLGFTKTHGWFREVSGEVSFDVANPSASNVSIAINAASVDTNYDKRDGWVMSDKVLDVAQFSTITFASTAIEITGDNTAKITGDFTMHGVTNRVVLDAVLNKNGTDPIAKRENLGFSATATLKRSDYGIMAFLGPIGDEITISIELESYMN